MMSRDPRSLFDKHSNRSRLPRNTCITFLVMIAICTVFLVYTNFSFSNPGNSSVNTSGEQGKGSTYVITKQRQHPLNQFVSATTRTTRTDNEEVMSEEETNTTPPTTKKKTSSATPTDQLIKDLDSDLDDVIPTENPATPDTTTHDPECPSFPLPIYPLATIPACPPRIMRLSDFPFPPPINSDPNHCSNVDFGQGLIDRWIKQEKRQCTMSEEQKMQAGSDEVSVTEYQLRQIRHTGPDSWYVVKNMDWILPTPSSRQRFHIPCQRNGGFHPDNQPAQGLAQFWQQVDYGFTNGKTVEERWKELIENDKSGTNVVASARALLDSAWSSSIHTFFLSRDCRFPYNPYHCLGDPINFFMQLHMLNLEPKNARIIFYDEDQGDTTMIDLWLSLAGQGVYTMDEVKSGRFPFGFTDRPNDVPEQLRSQSNLPPLHIRNAYVGMTSGMNMIWKDGHVPDVCASPSPVLQAFNSLAASVYLGLSGRPKPEIVNTVKRTWKEERDEQILIGPNQVKTYRLDLTRTPLHARNFTVTLPEPISSPASSLFIPGATTPFRILINSRRKAHHRRAGNEDELVAALRAEFTLAQNFEILQVDMIDLPFPEQVSLASSSRLIIGFHGAGLCLIAFHAAPQSSHLIELFPRESDRPRCYENMALREGMAYTAWVNHDESKNVGIDTFLDVKAIVEMVREAMEKMKRKN